MNRRIIPSIIAKDDKELYERLEKVRLFFKKFQLDIMDGKFVKNKSLNFDFTLPNGNYEAHLMLKNPTLWIEKYAKKVNTIIFHLESCKNTREVKAIIRLIKSKGKKPGIAINPRTPLIKLIPHISQLDVVLIMTVFPGKYGAKFLDFQLKKVHQLRKKFPKLNIEVDGGITDKTISRAAKAGANSFVSGSYLQKSKNLKVAIFNLNH